MGQEALLQQGLPWEDVWQPASLTGTLLLSHLHHLPDNAESPAFHLCLATVRHNLYVFQLPNGLNTCTHVSSSLHL